MMKSYLPCRAGTLWFLPALQPFWKILPAWVSRVALYVEPWIATPHDISSVSPLRINSELNLEWPQLRVDQWQIQLTQTCSKSTTSLVQEAFLGIAFTCSGKGCSEEPNQHIGQFSTSIVVKCQSTIRRSYTVWKKQSCRQYPVLGSQPRVLARI